jgi:hypothetical protein
MKKFINGLLKGRIIRWSILAVVLAVVGLSVAWLDRPCYRLGGGWIGGHPGFVWNLQQIPLDPLGQTEAFRVIALQWGTDFAGLLTGFGADSVTDCVGEGRMISHDTAKWQCVGYAQVAGNPPTTTAILVYAGTFKFTARDRAAVVYALNVFPAGADADGDGYPDAGAQPAVTIPVTDTAKRVPWQ